MQAWATILIGAIAAMIAYFQWVTAHQRIVLDLFDRRVSIFRIIQWVVLEVREAGGEVSQQVLQSFVLAELEARFLFGNDVRKLLAELRYDTTSTSE